MIDPLVGSAVVGGLANVAGGFMNNAFNSRQSELAYNRQVSLMREQNRFNAEQSRIAREYNTAERMSAQAYNSPSAQVSRLRAAGINGQSVSPAVSSPVSSSPVSASGLPQVTPFRADPINIGQPLQDLVNSAAVASGISKNQADIARDVRQLGLQSEDVEIRKQAQKVSANMANSSMAVNEQILKQVQEDTKLKSEELLSKQLYNKLYNDLAERGMKVQEQQADAALQSVAATLASIANSYRLGVMQLQQGYYFHENMSSYEKAYVSNDMKRINLEFANNLAQFRNQVWSLRIDDRYKRDIIRQAKRELDLDITKWRTDLQGRLGLNGLSSGALGLGMRLLR